MAQSANVAKAFYTDQSLPNILNDGEDGVGILEIVISNGEEDEETVVEPTKSEDFNKNLAEILDDSLLSSICSDLIADIKEDLNSRKDWEHTYEEGLELLGLKIETRTQPWNGACGVYHPILAESVVRFQSEMIMETFPASGPVKSKIIGKVTKEKEEAGKRVVEDMNYQLTEVMPDYRAEHERLLWALPIAGSAFKKVYFDPSLQRQVAMFIPAEDIIVPYGATTLEQSPRITHRMKKHKNDLKKLQAAGFYMDCPLGDPAPTITNTEKSKDKITGVSALNDPRYTLYEVHVELDLEGKDKFAKEESKLEIAVPYVVTINTANNTIFSIYRNWKEDDEEKLKRLHFVHYGYIPGFGFYHFGLIHLIGGFAKSATSILRQLVDAGTLSNLPGGLKTRGLRIKGDDTPIKPGEWRDVDIPGGAIRDNLLPLPYKEPSMVLAGLMDKIIDEARTFASMADIKASDMNQDAPVGTTLAVLERMLKVMSAVQARIHFAMKNEFKLLKKIIQENTPETYAYEPVGNVNEGSDEDMANQEDDERSAKREDYDMVEIIPVSDPNASTMSQRIVQFQAAFQLAATAPQIYDMTYLHAQMLETLGLKNIDKIIPSLEEGMRKPRDPVSENMDILMGRPCKVFLNQDHEAHLKVHINALQDPTIQQMIGQSPNAPLIQGALTAHITDHVAYAYRKQMEQTLGIPLPEPDAIMDDETEALFSQTMADASDILLQRNQAKAQQMAAAQQANDPLLALQQQEVQVKAMDAQTRQSALQLKSQEMAGKQQLSGGELQRKIQKDQMDAKLKMEQMMTTARTQTEQANIQAATQTHQANVLAASQSEQQQRDISSKAGHKVLDLHGQMEQQRREHENQISKGQFDQSHEQLMSHIGHQQAVEQARHSHTHSVLEAAQRAAHALTQSEQVAKPVAQPKPKGGK